MGRIILPDFKIYYVPVAIKLVQPWLHGSVGRSIVLDTKRLRVRSLVKALVGGNRWMFLSRSLSLSLSLKPIKKQYPQVRIEKQKRLCGISRDTRVNETEPQNRATQIRPTDF